MTEFVLPCSCPDCGGALVLVNSRATGATSIAIVECAPCRWQFEVYMQINPHARSESWQEFDRARRSESKQRTRDKRKMADVC